MKECRNKNEEVALRLLPLDALRGIAAFGVAFFWHYKALFQSNDISSFPLPMIGYWFYTYGWHLVDLFFVLSGFVFMYKYSRKIIDKKISLKEFSLLRLTRLYPLYAITLLIVFIVQIGRYVVLDSFFVYQYNDIYHFLLNIFFLQSNFKLETGYSLNAPSWSICSEIIAYIFFFIILIKYNKNYLLYFFLSIILSLIVIIKQIEIPFLNYYTARALLGFFVGCFVFKINDYVANNKKIAYYCFILLVFVTFIGILKGQNVFGNWPIVYVTLVYPLIIFSILNITFLKYFLSLQIFVFLGTISYSIYLWHFPVQLIVKTFDDLFAIGIVYESLLIQVLIISLTLIISYVSYEYFEKRYMNILRKKFITTAKYTHHAIELHKTK